MNNFKKGDSITGVSGNRNGKVWVQHYTVLSSGKLQMHLLKLDGSNAKTRHYHDNQDTYPTRFVMTADFTEVFAIDCALRNIETTRANMEIRKAHAIARDGSWSAFEQDVYAKNAAEIHGPEVAYL